MESFLLWVGCLPFFFISVIGAWLVAPIAPLFAKEYSLKNTWLYWCTTPDTNLLGDRNHQKRFEGKNKYLQQVWWIFRNPAVNFQRDVLGIPWKDTDQVITKGNEKAQFEGGSCFQRIVRDNRTIAWMIFSCISYPWFKDKAFRLLLGWKTWDKGKKNPLQFAFRITFWKSF